MARTVRLRHLSRIGVAAVGAATLALACAGSRRPAWEAPGNPAGCADAVARARARPLARRDSARVLEMRLPPKLPPKLPPRAAGRWVALEIPVDERGRPDTAGLVVRDAPDAQYEARMRQEVSRYRFQPARAGGCWVPGVAALSVTSS